MIHIGILYSVYILCVLPHGKINKYYLLHVLLLYILYVYKMKEYEKYHKHQLLKHLQYTLRYMCTFTL